MGLFWSGKIEIPLVVKLNSSAKSMTPRLHMETVWFTLKGFLISTCIYLYIAVKDEIHI